jgi:hypothetical protein
MRMGGQLHAPAALPPGKRPGTHCIGGWVGSMAGLDGWTGIRSPDRSARSESLYRLSYRDPYKSEEKNKLRKLLSVNKEFLPCSLYDDVCLHNIFIVILHFQENTVYLHYKEGCLKDAYGKASISVLITNQIRQINPEGHRVLSFLMFNKRYNCLPMLLKGLLISI